MTVFVDEQVTGFDVAVDDAGRVYVLECFERLIHHVLYMDWSQHLSSNGCVQVCVHVIEGHVDVLLV